MKTYRRLKPTERIQPGDQYLSNNVWKDSTCFSFTPGHLVYRRPVPGPCRPRQPQHQETRHEDLPTC
jgi:hypothetical protein